MNTLELLLLRKWIEPFADSLILEKQFIKEAQIIKEKIDKILWSTYISKKTPWGEMKEEQVIVEDKEFDKTLEEIFGRKDNE